MPMTYTDEMVREEANMRALDETGTEPIGILRERLASLFERKYEDPLAAWEVRTGRPWNTMTAGEAIDLITKHPEMIGNSGVISRLES